MGRYFRDQGLQLAEPAFLDEVVLQVGLLAGERYHVPLLVSPWSYSTYRGVDGSGACSDAGRCADVGAAGCDEAHFETDEWLERILFSPAAEEAAYRIKAWMEGAGCAVQEDALTNVSGLRAGRQSTADAPKSISARTMIR